MNKTIYTVLGKFGSICQWSVQNYQSHVKCITCTPHIPLHISLTFMQVWGITVYLKAIYCNTGGQLQAVDIKVTHPQYKHTFHTDHKNICFCISSPQDNVPIYVSFTNWLYLSTYIESALTILVKVQKALFFTWFYFILGGKYPILYALMVIRIYCKTIISWNIMPSAFIDT